MSNAYDTVVNDFNGRLPQSHLMDWSAEPANKKPPTIPAKFNGAVDLTSVEKPKTKDFKSGARAWLDADSRLVVGAFILVQLLYWRPEQVFAYMVFLGEHLTFIACVTVCLWEDDLLMLFRVLVLLIQTFFLIKGLMMFEAYAAKIARVIFDEEDN
ncbi:hypothetical protein FRC12_002849 [Ceratobasidium sp. 428]|nr:hypothetical protein FRC12_002849 [Ceratobasidium sp. 428]